MPSKRDLIRQEGYKKLKKKRMKEIEKLKTELAEEDTQSVPKQQGGMWNMIIGLAYIMAGTLGAVIAFIFQQFFIGIVFAVIMNILGWKRMSR